MSFGGDCTAAASVSVGVMVNVGELVSERGVLVVEACRVTEGVDVRLTMRWKGEIDWNGRWQVRLG